jgi:alpha-L-rhamnosidase
MFGGGITWFYRKLAGMNADPDKPGYRHIIFRPQPAGDITFASYSNRTPYGTASISWKKEQGKFIMKVSVPTGCSASVYVPAQKPDQVTESGKKAGKSNEVTPLAPTGGYAVFKINSGNYRFESAL